MSPLASVRVGVQALRTNPMRTVLSTLGVIIGVASLVAVLSLGDGMERFARSEMARTGSVQNVVVSPITQDSIDGIAVAREHVPLFGVADVRSAGQEVRDVEGVVLTYSGTTLIDPPGGGRPRAARVTAASANAAEFFGVAVKWGRFLSADDEARDAPVAVASHTLAAALSPADPGALVGRAVRFRGGERRIVGVMAPEPDAQGLAVYVPVPAGPAVMMPGEASRPRSLVFRARSVEEIDQAEKAVQGWLARTHPQWRRDYTVSTARRRAAEVMKGIAVFKLFMGAITAISLLVGGIGIMNVLLASVTERTREIGIRKAVGARRRDITLQFLAESVAISGSGSVVGVVLGLAGAMTAAALMRSQTHQAFHAGLSISTMVVAALSAVIVGLSFGTYPALRAARLSPIDAIRHE